MHVKATFTISFCRRVVGEEETLTLHNASIRKLEDSQEGQTYSGTICLEYGISDVAR